MGDEQSAEQASRMIATAGGARFVLGAIMFGQAVALGCVAALAVDSLGVLPRASSLVIYPLSVAALTLILVRRAVSSCIEVVGERIVVRNPWRTYRFFRDEVQSVRVVSRFTSDEVGGFSIDLGRKRPVRAMATYQPEVASEVGPLSGVARWRTLP